MVAHSSEFVRFGACVAANFTLNHSQPGTEFLDAETRRLKSSFKRVNARRDKICKLNGRKSRQQRPIWRRAGGVIWPVGSFELIQALFASRDDGRKLVDYYEKQDLKSATIQKKIGWLTAAVNLAIDEATLKFNPFSSIVPERDDKQRRLPLSETDIRNVKRNLDWLDEGDQRLFRLLAATGMRLSEAFDIDDEMKERGCRYIIVGRKTSQSLRRVPLPATLLPFLPRKIEGRLFTGGPKAASKRLKRFLNKAGIADPRKVVHSLRHRAQDRLRAAGCPEDCRWAILGHEEETVAEGYGEGFPVPLLKRWIDKIGF